MKNISIDQFQVSHKRIQTAKRCTHYILSAIYLVGLITCVIIICLMLWFIVSVFIIIMQEVISEGQAGIDTKLIPII